MNLYIFAGPNGSGKSTIINNYIRENNLFDTEYVCPDIYASKLFSGIEDIYERYIKAMKFAEYKRNKLLDNHESFIMETVLSRTDKLDFIEQARSVGYHIIVIFVSTESEDINIARVKKRVSEGGHDVPEEKLRERFKRSMNNLPFIAGLADELYIYDNTTTPRIVASRINGHCYTADDAPKWALIF